MKWTITFAFAAILVLWTFQVKAESPTNPVTTEVVASGVGIDSDKALRNALMNAVQQAVGLVVDAETLVKNEDVVKEQILTYSDGYVDHFDTIKEGKRDDGLYEVKIKATIKRRQLIEKLKASKVIATKVEGESIFGEVVTQMAAARDAAQLLQHALEGLPLNLLTARVADKKPRISNATDTEVKATWRVLVSYDYNNWTGNVVPALQKTLGDIAKQKGNSSIVIRPADRPFGYPMVGPIITTPTTKSAVWAMDYCNVKKGEWVTDPEGFLLLLCTSRNERAGDERFSWYFLDKNCWPILKALSSHNPRLEVTLSDPEKNVIRQDMVDVNEQGCLFSDPSRADFVLVPSRSANTRLVNFPGLLRLDYLGQCASPQGGFKPVILTPTMSMRKSNGVENMDIGTVELDWTVDLSLDEMKKITEIKCQFVESSN